MCPRELHLSKIMLPFNISYQLQPRAYARGGGGWGFKPPTIDLSTKMHNKENITFLAFLSLFFCNDTDSNMI